MPVHCSRRIKVVEGVGVPAGKVSVSLLSSYRGSGLVGRTSHELEGHGHALLIVRHVCGISRGVLGWAVAVVRVEWRGGGLVCLLAWVCDRGRRRRRKPPRRKPLRTCQAKLPFAGDLRLQQSRTGACYTIDPSDLSYASPLHSTHNAVHSCLQHAQAARHARLPPPAAREGPAPPGLSQDEVARSCMYTKTRLLV
jgi:hypothetical protein